MEQDDVDLPTALQLLDKRHIRAVRRLRELEQRQDVRLQLRAQIVGIRSGP